MLVVIPSSASVCPLTCDHEACDSYSVPEHVREHIDIILPTVNFDARILPRSNLPRSNPNPTLTPAHKGAAVHPLVKTEGKQATGIGHGSLANCDQEITPDCLRALYNFHYTPVATDKNSYGIGTQSHLLVTESVCVNPSL
jgi:tripeptidyl-peptidase I